MKILLNKNNNQYETILMLLSCNNVKTTKDFIFNYKKNTDLEKINLIWLDNGSTDETVDYLQKELSSLSSVTLFSSSKNLGVISGRNYIWKYSIDNFKDHKYFMFLDNDQYVKEDWYNQHLNFLIDGDYDIIGVEAWLMNYSFLPVERIDKLNKPYTYVGCGGSLIKKNVVDDIGIYDDNFNPSYFEDPDYIFRANKKGYKIGWNYKNLIQHLPHQTLGKIGNEEKNRRFIKSLNYFRSKWKGTKTPIFRQYENSNTI